MQPENATTAVQLPMRRDREADKARVAATDGFCQVIAMATLRCRGT